MENFEDRRMFQRFAVDFPLRFLELNSNKQGQAQTVDISAQGIGLVSDKKLTVHAPLELWLEIPDDRQPMYTRGEVMWTQPAEDNKFRIGINLERVEFMGLARALRASKIDVHHMS